MVVGFLLENTFLEKNMEIVDDFVKQLNSQQQRQRFRV